MLALAWLIGVAGAAVAYVISLAGAMKTVPSLPWREALVGLPLPLVAGALAAWCLFRPRPAGNEPRWIAASGALALAAFTLLLLWVSYFEQPGGPR